MSQNFAFVSYGPGAGTSNASVGTSATTGVLVAQGKYAFVGSGKFFIRFGTSTAVAAATSDLWLPADTIGVFDTTTGVSDYVSFYSASGTITVTFARVS